MSKSTPSLDRFRSTRTRIVKPRACSSAASSSASSAGLAEETEGSNQTEQVAICDWSRHFGNHNPLRVVFVGHNPSTKSWTTIAPYAHGSNHLWKILQTTGLVPQELCEPRLHTCLPERVGIGFIDLFVSSGSDASRVQPNAEKDMKWRRLFLERFERATMGKAPMVVCCVSKIVGRKMLGGWKGEFGCVGNGREWQLKGLEKSEIWVMPSTSGRAGMTWEQRVGPFKKLAERLRRDDE